MANAPLRLVTPTTKKRTVIPKRAKNSDLRTREYLTEHEIEALMAELGEREPMDDELAGVSGNGQAAGDGDGHRPQPAPEPSPGPTFEP